MKGKEANNRRYKKLPEYLDHFEHLREWLEKIAAGLRDGSLDLEEFAKNYEPSLDEVRAM